MKEPLLNEIGQRIKETRVKENVSQAELSELTGISTTQLSAYENGKKGIGLYVLARIAHALNTTIDALYFGPESIKPISTANNKGELIVNCMNALFAQEVVKLLPHEEKNPFVFDNYSIVYRLGFYSHLNSIEDLVEKLTDFEKNKDNYDDPVNFKKQILKAAANEINKN